MLVTHYANATAVGPETGTTTNTLTVVAALPPGPGGRVYSTATIFLENTGATNSLNYEIRAYAFQGATHYRIIRNAALAAGAINEILVDRQYGFLEVLMQATVAGNQTTYAIELSGGP